MWLILNSSKTHQWFLTVTPLYATQDPMRYQRALLETERCNIVEQTIKDYMNNRLLFMWSQ